MDEQQWLADRFEEHRARLHSVAYRMLGSLADADDAVQDAWMRVSRAGTGDVDNLGGWLTTIVARVCLNTLRARSQRREEPLGVRVPDPQVRPLSAGDPADPAEQAVLADSVGLALLVVLDTLSPPERLAFVLHDLFGLPFAEIAPLAGRSPAAARQLASRARRRIKGAGLPGPGPDLAGQRRMVDLFLTAARHGNVDDLVAALDPGVVLRIDAGPRLPSASMVVRGADAVAAQTARGLTSALAGTATTVHPAIVSGGAGVVVTVGGRPVTVMGFTIRDGRIAEIDAIADPDRVPRLAAALIG